MLDTLNHSTQKQQSEGCASQAGILNPHTTFIFTIALQAIRKELKPYKASCFCSSAGASSFLVHTSTTIVTSPSWEPFNFKASVASSAVAKATPPVPAPLPFMTVANLDPGKCACNSRKVTPSSGRLPIHTFFSAGKLLKPPPLPLPQPLPLP